ncbi:HTH-type transcriptional regulator AbgR [Delftia tsuruhatensis]|uniref:LysR family transcriptional regulator n=1 Tax=Delftia tsuruhatensis TaxID=180282 RepID=UPI001E6ECA50|nr:LysR family transcriptional regulator [Delftia tsuruhatensis]CAB5675114.1 HTH-type transcriptional regulator AbgR [Delftia tsuruhatensis]CAC9692601.1 HTH-type transcriptional regulator AbgR [Delftia tsuruhatensis]
MQWDDARIFLAIARTGSLSGASAALGLGVATVSRRLDRLEAALAVPLFSRHQSGYRLTDDGQALLAPAEALEHAARALGEAAHSQAQVAGVVRLATAENLANPLILPSLAQLFERHPGLRVQLVSGVQTLNLHRRDADLAVRMTQPAAGHLTIRRLGTLGFGLYGAPAYVHNRIAQAGAAPFDGDAFIGWDEDHAHLPAARWLARTLRGRPLRLETNTLSAQLAAVEAGLGLAVLPHFLARRGGLACVARQLGADQPIWLAMHADLCHSRRVRAVADHLIALFEAQRADLEGLA